LRLWVDLLTPKQVLFFGPLIDLLRSRGHEVLATGRHFREVDQLAELTGLKLVFVGERGGKEPASQLKASLNRMEKLLPLVEGFEPDASLSVASVDCARISFGIRTRHVAVNDSPHSAVAARLSLPLSHHLLTPWLIPFDAWTRYGIGRRAITRYRALDPAAWLKRARRHESAVPALDSREPTIVVRLEESYAPYMIGTDRGWGERLLAVLVKEFKGSNIVVLYRYEDQLSRITSLYSKSCIFPRGVVDGVELLQKADLFVGLGGTMTTEAALLGVPAVSAFQGGLLYTESYLTAKGILRKSHNPQEIVRLGRQLLQRERREAISRKAKAVLDSMEDPVERVAEYLGSLAS
jgi:predicted glycosyltransferase